MEPHGHLYYSIYALFFPFVPVEVLVTSLKPLSLCSTLLYISTYLTNVHGAVNASNGRLVGGSDAGVDLVVPLDNRKLLFSLSLPPSQHESKGIGNGKGG